MGQQILTLALCVGICFAAAGIGSPEKIRPGLA
jgi:hypothetical protein